MRKTSFALLLIGIVTLSATAKADGPADYKGKCQVCHAVNASGETPAGKKLGAKDLRLPEILKKSDDEWVAIIRDGRKKMPPFKGKLSDQQMKDLVVLIRGMK